VGNPGEDRLKASFVVDDQRRLRLTVTDLKTRKTLLKDVVIAHLQARDTGENRADQRITGHEPRLADGAVQWGQRRLSLRNIAAMLSVLPPDAISPEAAAAALNSASFQARYSAAKALSRRADRDARRVMQEVLTNGNTPARASAARHLYGFSWFTAEPLVRLALADSDSRVREAVMYALCDFRELRAYQLMAQALEDEEDNVCEAAAYGLRDCQDPAAVPVLAAALRAIDPDVRVRALEALSANDTPQAVPVVRAALGDADPDVQYAAVASLLELIGVQALDELADLIEQARGRSRQRILAGFFHATNYLNINNAKQQAADRLLDALEAALHDDLPGVRIAAIYPLAWMRHPRAASLLTGAYDRESDSSAKAEIVRVAAGLMSTVGEAILQDALASSDPAVRQAADQIMLERERAGGALTYDETAQAGTGLSKPSVGR
jgi:HEAT repeat protein